MIVAAFTGEQKHGKTTLADFVAEQVPDSHHIEAWEQVNLVASPLHAQVDIHPAPDDIEAINRWIAPMSELLQTTMRSDIPFSELRLTHDRVAKHPDHYKALFEYLGKTQLDPKLITTQITPETKEEFRPLLQWVGGYVIEKGGPVWFTEIARQLSKLHDDGVQLATVGGVRYPAEAEILKSIHPSIRTSIIEIIRPDLAKGDTSDLTERQRKLIKPDKVVYNNGAVEDLAALAPKLWRDLYMWSLHREYFTKPQN